MDSTAACRFSCDPNATLPTNFKTAGILHMSIFGRNHGPGPIMEKFRDCQAGTNTILPGGEALLVLGM